MIAPNILKYVFGLTMIMQAQAVPLVEQAFDKAFSIGLLLIGLVIIWRSYQKTTDYNQTMLERTTSALENNTAVLQIIAEKLDKN